MSMQVIFVVLTTGLFASLADAPRSAAAAAPQIVIVSSEHRGKTGVLSFLDATSWESKAAVPLAQGPLDALLLDGERKLGVLCGEAATRKAPDETLQGAFWLFDMQTHEVLGKWSPGSGPCTLFPATEGDTLVVCVARGRQGAGAGVSVISTSSSREVGRLRLEGELIGSCLPGDGQRLSLFQDSSGPRAARVLWVDLNQPAIRGEVPLAGSPAGWLLSPDRRVLYVLTRGDSTSHQREVAVDRVAVLDLSADSLLASAAVGASASMLAVTTLSGTCIVWSQDGTDPSHHLLTLLGGDGVPKSFPIEGELADVSQVPGVDQVALATDKGMVVVDVSAGRLLPPIETRVRGQGTELVVTDDGKKVFMINSQHSRLSIVDLEAGREVDELSLGRTGTKLFRAALPLAGGLMADLADTYDVSYGVPRGYYARQWETTLQQYELMQLLFPFRERPLLYVGPDGKFLYALNHGTDDVNVVDVARDSVIARIPTGDACLRMKGVPELNRLMVFAHDHQFTIDTARNVRLEKIQSSGWAESGWTVLGVDTATRLAFIGEHRNVRVIGLEDGREIARIRALGEPRYVLWSR
jgi:YVTN family beta-propeller protein